jgi:two-component system chemotaxis response regulator CheB
MNKKRILVVDDSLFMQELICNIIESTDMLEVVGRAANGQDALEMTEKYLPDLITLDIIMPEMDGLQTLVELRKRWPHKRVIMVSSVSGSGTDATLDALALGADDYVAKPVAGTGIGSSIKQLGDELIPKIIALCDVSETERLRGMSTSRNMPCGKEKFRARVDNDNSIGILAIGISTGGPEALARVLPQLPGDLKIPVVIVQHMPAEFTSKLAQRLDIATKLKVKEGKPGDKLRGGTVYIAPGDFHMVLDRIADEVVISLNQNAPENSCRPAVDVLFRSVEAIYGACSMAVVMTGMGNDGVKGAQSLADAGSTILVQDRASSVVWGMPGLVAQAGIANAIVPLDMMADTIMHYLTSVNRCAAKVNEFTKQSASNSIQNDANLYQRKIS